MGVFPRVARWDDDDRKDLILGTEEGKVRLYLNIGTDAAPIFDDGAFLLYGPPGDKIEINHFCSAAPCIVDWDEDGRRDLLMGASDGCFHLYINELGNCFLAAYLRKPQYSPPLLDYHIHLRL